MLLKQYKKWQLLVFEIFNNLGCCELISKAI